MSADKQIVIVDSPVSCDSFLKSRDKNSICFVYAMHNSATDYLFLNGIEAVDIMSLTESDPCFTNRIFQQTSSWIRDEMEALDALFSVKLSKELEIPYIPWFRSTYGYHGIYEGSGFLVMSALLKFASEKHDCKKFMVYESAVCSFFRGSVFRGVAEFLSKANDFVFNFQDVKGEHCRLRREAPFATRVFRFVKRRFQRALKRFDRPSLARQNFDRFLYLPPPYELRDFVAKHGNLKAWPAKDDQVPLETISRLREIVDEVPEVFSDNTLESAARSYVRRTVVEDFRNSLHELASPLATAKRLFENEAIDYIIYGNPPSRGKSLACALGRAVGKRTIEIQHGAIYGIHENDWRHYEGDYLNADVFLSFGWETSDLDLAPELIEHLTVIPVGSCVKSPDPKPHAIDVLFPITNCIGAWQAKVRVNSHTLYCWQKQILTYLQTRSIHAVVKPMPGSSDLNFAFAHRLSRPGQPWLVELAPLRDVLEKTRPRIVILEFLSTPLYEVLPYDCEIFVIALSTNPLKPKFHRILEKRVHIFDDTESLLAGVDKFLKGDLPAKRDNTFLNQQVRYCDDSLSRLESVLENIDKYAPVASPS